jgi:hypothetical protein
MENVSSRQDQSEEILGIEDKGEQLLHNKVL